MTEPIAPIAPVIAVTPIQPTLSANFISSIAQSVAQNDNTQILNIGQTSNAQTAATNSTSDNYILNNANLSPEAITALNSVESGDVPTSTSGNLTSVQLQEIATLASDANMLNMEQVTPFTSDNSILDSASMINLSSQAENILSVLNSVTSINAVTSLTTIELQQLATIIAPFINTPLTPATLTQIQNTLTLAGFNPYTLSLQTLLLSINYVAELTPVSAVDAEQLAQNELIVTAIDA